MIQPDKEQHELALALARRHLGHVFTQLAVARIRDRGRRVTWIVSELSRQGLQIPATLNPFKDERR
jgi:hypothetical protein